MTKAATESVGRNAPTGTEQPPARPTGVSADSGRGSQGDVGREGRAELREQSPGCARRASEAGRTEEA